MGHLAMILKVIMGLCFILGVVKVIFGLHKLRQGEEAISDIIGGAGMALAPTIVYAFYTMLGMGSSAIDPNMLN